MRWLAPALAILAGAVAAQPARQERRTVAWHQGLLAEVWQAVRAADAAGAARIEAALAQPPNGNPFGSVIAALAAAEGATVDDAYRARRMLHAVALPEVVDPEVFEGDSGSQPYRLHVTIASPLALAEARWAFRVLLCDAAGKVVAEQSVASATSDDLARLAVKLAIPVADLPDGRYRVEVRADVDDRHWQKGDPVAPATVWVQRGFAAATEALEARAAGMAEAAKPPLRALLRGAVWPLVRVYGGHAGEGDDDLARAQRHAGTVLDAVAAGRPPLAGADGFLPLVVPVGEGEAVRDVALRVRPARGGDGARAGVVVFVPGDPTWDGLWARPTLARTTPPGFLADALVQTGFDAERRATLVVLESPGDHREPQVAVRAALDAVAALLPVDLERVVLVGEREGGNAVMAAWQRGVLSAPPRGVVLALHGGVSRTEAELVARTPVLLIPGQGHASGENMLRGAAQLGHTDARDRVRVRAARNAWPLALRLALPEIDEFCAEHLGR